MAESLEDTKKVEQMAFSRRPARLLFPIFFFVYDDEEGL